MLLSFHNTLHSAPKQIQIYGRVYLEKKIWMDEAMDVRDPGSSLIVPSEEKKQGPLPVSPSSQATPLLLGCSGVDFSLDGAVQL